MQAQGWRHAVALLFWGDPPAEMPIFVTSAYRIEGQSDFSEQDIAGLEGIHPYLDCAVNRLHEREAAKTVRDGMAAVRDETRGFAILDGNLLPVQANPLARQLCAAWADDGAAAAAEGSSQAFRLPPAILAACHELRHEWQSLLRVDPDATDIRRSRQVHSHVPGLTASITMVCPQTTGLAEPTFVLELDRLVHGVALDNAGPIAARAAEDDSGRTRGGDGSRGWILEPGDRRPAWKDRLCGEVSTPSHLSEDRHSGPRGAGRGLAFAPEQVGEARWRDKTGATGSTVRLKPDTTY